LLPKAGILSFVDEGRKRVLLIAARILAARKLAQYGSEAQVPATICAIADAIRWAEEIVTGETSTDSLITSSQVIITAREIREIVLR
jgi:hypothetical protein